MDGISEKDFGYGHLRTKENIVTDADKEPSNFMQMIDHRNQIESNQKVIGLVITNTILFVLVVSMKKSLVKTRENIATDATKEPGNFMQMTAIDIISSEQSGLGNGHLIKCLLYKAL